MSIVTNNDLADKLSFGLPDRLEKALTVADITSIAMAEYLGVSRTTISNYTNGRTPVKKQTLRLWAMRTGVPLSWIETGILSEPGQGPDDGGSRLGESNSRPSHYKVTPLFESLRELAVA